MPRDNYTDKPCRICRRILISQRVWLRTELSTRTELLRDGYARQGVGQLCVACWMRLNRPSRSGRVTA